MLLRRGILHNIVRFRLLEITRKESLNVFVANCLHVHSSTKPNTDALLARRAAAVPKGLALAHPVFIDRAVNAQLFDVDGRRFLDFAGGIAVMNVGHSHPAVRAAVHAQIDKFRYVAVCA